MRIEYSNWAIRNSQFIGPPADLFFRVIKERGDFPKFAVPRSVPTLQREFTQRIAGEKPSEEEKVMNSEAR
jgi:hypothetical protein